MLPPVVIASGLRDAGNEHRLTSIEYEARYLEPSAANLERHGVRDRVDLLQGDSSEVVRDLGMEFDTVFVDGDHSYEGVKRDLDALGSALAPGAVVMFHDYYHPLNDSGEYGVQRAVDESSEASGWEFRGRCGGIALYEQC